MAYVFRNTMNAPNPWLSKPSTLAPRSFKAPTTGSKLYPFLFAACQSSSSPGMESDHTRDDSLSYFPVVGFVLPSFAFTTGNWSCAFKRLRLVTSLTQPIHHALWPQPVLCQHTAYCRQWISFGWTITEVTPSILSVHVTQSMDGIKESNNDVSTLKNVSLTADDYDQVCLQSLYAVWNVESKEYIE